MSLRQASAVRTVRRKHQACGAARLPNTNKHAGDDCLELPPALLVDVCGVTLWDGGGLMFFFFFF